MRRSSPAIASPRWTCSATTTSCRLLDRHPRSLLEIFAPEPGMRSRDGWRRVDPGDADGRAVLDAVVRGSLWVLLPQVQRHDEAFAELNSRLDTELTEIIPGFVEGTMTSTLLVSSPTATVPYHVDTIPNLLWHVRGEKSARIYPADDDTFVDPRHVEDILAGDSPEYLPYDPDFERAVVSIDLVPGDVLAFPHYAPHRVENTAGLNVSLNTELDTMRTRRRNHVRIANRYFSRAWHLPMHGRAGEGRMASAKRVAHRAVRRLGLDAHHARPPAPAPQLRIDPDAPEGISPIVGRVDPARVTRRRDGPARPDRPASPRTVEAPGGADRSTAP